MRPFWITYYRITKKILEKYFGTTKIANGNTGLYPAEYATISAYSVITSCKNSTISKKSSKNKSNNFFDYVLPYPFN